MKRSVFELGATLALCGVVLGGCGRSDLSDRRPGEELPDMAQLLPDSGALTDEGGEPLPDLGEQVDLATPPDMADLGRPDQDLPDQGVPDQGTPDMPPGPSCTDELKNGDESGVDCGGFVCPACQVGEQCRVASDCLDGRCESGVCVDPLLPVGASCDDASQCTSGLCQRFGDQQICTVQCAQGTCPTNDLACFEGLCVPVEYCENPNGQGNGPGCNGSGCMNCADNQICVERGPMNMPRFQCVCADGYRQNNGGRCVDINECSRPDRNDCAQNAACTNTDGSYTCTCDPGFAGDGRTCQDIDECAQGMTLCHPDADCINTTGDYTCSCKPGFAGDGTTCQDIDECALEADDCHQNATCTNTNGGFTCACEAGFMGDGRNCQDIDECADPAACPQGAICFNLPGSFSCGCPTGYVEQNGQCVDIDECADPALNDCDANASCANTPGSFTCVCDPGFTGDGRTCTPAMMGRLGDTCVNPFDISAAPFTRSNDTSGFDNDYQRPANACPNGAFSPRGAASPDQVYRFTPTQTGVYNVEVQDRMFSSALTITTNCSDIQNTCVGSDTFDPSFPVTLQAGTTYYLIVDGASNFNAGEQGPYTLSLDLDECASNLDNCGANAQCQDTFGSFVCSCDTGYIQQNGQCVDIDECADPALNDCDANATCSNTPGDFSCACNAGFIGDGRSCWDPAAPGESCAAATPIAMMPFALTGTTADNFNDYFYDFGQCPGDPLRRGAASPDEVYSFTPPMDGTYRFDLTGSYGVSLYVVTDCAMIGTSCQRAASRLSDGNVNVTLAMSAGTTYFLIVDGAGNNSSRSGNYVLSGLRTGP